MNDTTLYGNGMLPHAVRWQGSTYLSQSYGAPFTFTQDFSSATNWWTPALEGQTQALADYNQNIFIGNVEGFWIFRLYLDGNLVGTYTFFDQSFTVPITFDRVEAVAMGGVPFGSSSAFVSAAGWNSSPPVTDNPPSVPEPGMSLMCMMICALGVWSSGRRSRYGRVSNY